MRLERAKALNALGAALRGAIRPHEAEAAFAKADVAFAEVEAPLERGAALFNLGVVRRELGRPEAAMESLREARALLEPERAPRQAAAAARELGSAALDLGDVGAATAHLQRSLELGERAGDHTAVGAAANALGLARLAANDVAAALEAFRTGLAATPRTVRPAEHAMLKANIALAYERNRQDERARLAARQALAVPSAPQPVGTQAQAVLDRLGTGADDLVAVLADETAEQHAAIVREEVVRWVDAPNDEDARAWIDRVARDRNLAELLLGALLELPTDEMERLIRALLECMRAADESERERFRAAVASATARFHTPQLLRLRETLDRLSHEAGLPEHWS
jgi:tetratricopeptide (TPR) repeat protein